MHTLTIPSSTFIVNVIASTASPQSVRISHWVAANRLQMNPAQTELLWAGTEHNVSSLGCHAPTLQLGLDIVTPRLRATTFMFWQLPFRRIWAATSTSWRSARRASTTTLTSPHGVRSFGRQTFGRQK